MSITLSPSSFHVLSRATFQEASMTYTLITPPVAEPLALADVKAHLRIDGEAEDDLLASLSVTAREHLERTTGLVLMRQGLRVYLDQWPACGTVEITRGPVAAIDDIRIYDADGIEASLDLSGHVLDGGARPARLWLRNRPAPGQALNGIEIEFTAGFGDTAADVPDTLRRAMLLHVALMWEFRGVITQSQQPAAVPEGYDRLVAPWLIRRL
jgi:uncharacterized phiE125 gp8 family phage protein